MLGNNNNWYTAMSIQEIIQRNPNTSYNAQRRIRLSSLIVSISHLRKSIATINMFAEYALNIDYMQPAQFCKRLHKKQNVKSSSADLKKDIQSGQFQINQTVEPMERFLLTAISKAKSWEDIIEENKLNILFPSQHCKKWQMREAWLLLLCLSRFPEKQGLVITFRLLERQRRPSKRIFGCAKKIPYFQKKLKTWLQKSEQQLLHIYDDDERNILIAVSSKVTFENTLQLLRRSNKFLLKKEVEKDCIYYWICFLSSKCQGNDLQEYPDIEWNMRSLVWTPYPIHLKKKVDVYKKNEIKLGEILEQYQNFQNYFTDEVEVILLKAIKNKIEWAKTKQSINSLFSKVENGKAKSKRKENLHSKSRILPRELTQDVAMNGDSFELTNVDSQSLKPSKQAVKRKGTMSKLAISQIIDNNFEDDSQNKTVLVYPNAKANDEGAQGRKGAIKQNSFDLNKEQKMVLSMLEKGRQYLNSVETAYFPNVSSSHLQLISHKSKAEIAPIAQNQLNYYRSFPEAITSIEDQNIKTLVRTLLIATSLNEVPPAQEPQQAIKVDEEEEDLSVLFVKGYNKIVQQLGLSKRLLVEVDSKNGQEFKEEEES